MSSPIRFAKIRKQLEAAGYRLVRISSSHHIFERPGRPIVSIPLHNQKVKPFYARQVEKIIAADESAEGRRTGEQKRKADEGSGPKGKQ
jgi:predicted RNA binding protein YcfA (HicA-like mRNA interferase family)